MFKTLFHSTSLLLVATLTLASCGNNATSSDGTAVEPTRTQQLTPKPRGIGNVNRLNVIADPVILEGPVGDSLHFYYEQAYPLMPQPEALYDLRYHTPDELKTYPARKEMRTYLLLADLNDPSSQTTRMLLHDIGEEQVYAARENFRKGTSIATNRWATDQLVVYLFAEGPDQLAKLVAQSFPAARKRIAQADAAKLEANIYQSGHASQLPDSVAQLTGVRLDLPTDYRAAKLEDNFAWLRRDLGQVVQNILVTSVPYTGTEQISVDSAILYRNYMGRKAVRSNTLGSYMTTNDEDLPVLTDVLELNGNYAFEARGIWEMTDDFMGGPFFTYLLPNADAGLLHVIDVFAFAPSKGKRNYMQQLERIVQTVELE